MEAKELRIGNTIGFVFSNTHDGVEYYENIKVDAEDIAQLEAVPDRTDYRPIALTTEILEECRFEKLEFGNGFMFGISLGGGRIFLLKYNLLRPDCFYEHYYGTKVQYLHQLQNHYFALTGEELTITL